MRRPSRPMTPAREMRNRQERIRQKIEKRALWHMRSFLPTVPGGQSRRRISEEDFLHYVRRYITSLEAQVRRARKANLNYATRLSSGVIENAHSITANAESSVSPPLSNCASESHSLSSAGSPPSVPRHCTEAVETLIADPATGMGLESESNSPSDVWNSVSSPASRLPSIECVFDSSPPVEFYEPVNPSATQSWPDPYRNQNPNSVPVNSAESYFTSPSFVPQQPMERAGSMRPMEVIQIPPFPALYQWPNKKEALPVPAWSYSFSRSLLPLPPITTLSMSSSHARASCQQFQTEASQFQTLGVYPTSQLLASTSTCQQLRDEDYSITQTRCDLLSKSQVRYEISQPHSDQGSYETVAYI